MPISQYIESEIKLLLKDSNSFITNKNSIESKSILSDMQKHLTELLKWLKEQILDYLKFSETKEQNIYKIACLSSLEWCYSFINMTPIIESVLTKEYIILIY